MRVHQNGGISKVDENERRRRLVKLGVDQRYVKAKVGQTDGSQKRE